MSRTHRFLLASLLLSGLGACKKDSENAPSKTDLLTTKSWRVTAYTIITATVGSNPSTTTSDQYAARPACVNDNFYKFKTDKSLTLDEGPTKCNTNDPQTTSSTWAFNGDETKLLVTATTLSGLTITQSELLELSASTLRLRETRSYTTSGNTVTTTLNTTYTSF